VALWAGDRSKPEKKLGGGGKSAVSGTKASLDFESVMRKYYPG
jgi:hypothetical protein